MKKLLLQLLVFVSANAWADWEKIDHAASAASATSEKFIDPKSIRQTGPMNTMRRVWEISNLSQPTPNKVLSVKNLVEYDCKDRRLRVLEESYFSEHGALGDPLDATEQNVKTGDWRDIGKGSLTETIFNRVCPNDGT